MVNVDGQKGKKKIGVKMESENRPVVEVPMQNSDKKAIIDAEDWSKVSRYEWRLATDGTPFCCPKGLGTILLRRFVLGIIVRDRKSVKHKDGNSLNCTKQNLEVSTYKHIYRGVEKNVDCLSWRFRFTHGGKSFSKGGFATPEAAAKGYDRTLMWRKGRKKSINLVNFKGSLDEEIKNPYPDIFGRGKYKRKTEVTIKEENQKQVKKCELTGEKPIVLAEINIVETFTVIGYEVHSQEEANKRTLELANIGLVRRLKDEKQENTWYVLIRDCK